MRRWVVLCVLDGWGHRESSENNAVALGFTPHFDRLWRTGPRGLLRASGQAVGLQEGQVGNSEVGHLTLGAGRIIPQDLPKISQAIAQGGLRDHPVLERLSSRLKETKGRCHLLGLISPGGVHAHCDHITAIVKELSSREIPLILHLITDGRDVLPMSAGTYVRQFLDQIKDCSAVSIGTLSGRYYAMDRNRYWDRVALAYAAIVEGKGRGMKDPLEGIERSYREGVTDEFIEPRVMEGYGGMREGDGLVSGNFREDRIRQILRAILEDDFMEFERGGRPRPCFAVGLRRYGAGLERWMESLFYPETVRLGLGEALSLRRRRQLRIAETEKYPHVTYFFNGGREEIWEGEDRILLPSPNAATYDQTPEMSSSLITDRVVEEIGKDAYDFILLNYASPDMVGHTGNQGATIRAVESVDRCLGRLERAVAERGGILIVTADHGNCDRMRDPLSGSPDTAHTDSLVPIILVNGTGVLREGGGLADVAPTILALMDVDKPSVMTGSSLLVSG